MSIKDKEFISDFIQASISNALEFVQGFSGDEHTQLLFYRRLSENLGFYFSENLNDFDSDSLLYEKYNH